MHQMKNLMICSITCFLFVFCGKQNNDLSKVEAFIETLKENKTERIEAPDFNDGDISELLNFRNDQLKISNFPRNPLSSFYMEEVTIGMYVLWIVESIRMEAIDDPDFYLFASLNPRIARESTVELVDQSAILLEVAVAYFDWWNTSLSIEQKLQINPLEELDLRWN